MISIRKSSDRGHARHGWLESRHTFSFADYHDPDQMGFRALRVINEDVVEPGRGFATHSHREMEILSYVVDGALEHKDSLGNGSVIRPGDVQRMSAGTGVTHSEYNHSQSDPVRFLQIWVVPAERGIGASYEQRHFPEESRSGALRLVGSGNPRDGAVRIHQDVDVYASLLAGDESVQHEPAPGRGVWLQLVKGRVAVNGREAARGDGVAVIDEGTIAITAAEPSELLLFDLA